MNETPEPSTSLPVHAGFPNPAEDAGGFALDLNDYLVKRPVSTYYVRVQGDAMEAAGIGDGDIAVVDRSLEPRAGDVVVAAVAGDFVIRRLRRRGAEAWLMAAREGEGAIALDEGEAVLWGVVTFVVHKLR